MSTLNRLGRFSRVSLMNISSVSTRYECKKCDGLHALKRKYVNGTATVRNINGNINKSPSFFQKKSHCKFSP